MGIIFLGMIIGSVVLIYLERMVEINGFLILLGSKVVEIRYNLIFKVFCVFYGVNIGIDFCFIVFLVIKIGVESNF